MTIFDKFRLDNEKEDHEKVIASIETGIVFKGTNLWVLILAIFVASLGLKVNSTAVIIGAMLISPLMGPIMGIGFWAWALMTSRYYAKHLPIILLQHLWH